MIIKEILNRRSVREYKTDAVREEDIIEIIKAGQFAPSAKNNRAVEFVVVRNQKTKNTISEIVGQEFVKVAPVLIIPASDTAKTDFSIQDLAVVSENMFLQAVALGLGSVWKNVRPEWEGKVKELLGIPENYTVINIIPVGLPETKPEPRTNKDFDGKKIHKEIWQGK
ncbi:MAG: nitroreductase family protein [Patescibacteria group bacterium]